MISSPENFLGSLSNPRGQFANSSSTLLAILLCDNLNNLVTIKNLFSWIEFLWLSITKCNLPNYKMRRSNILSLRLPGSLNVEMPASELVTNSMFIFFYLQPLLKWRHQREGMFNHIWSVPCLKQLELLIITIIIAHLWALSIKCVEHDCMGIVCLEIPLSAHDTATYIILFLCLGSLCSFQTRNM